MQLQEGTLPMTELESAAVNKLIAKHTGKPISMTRRDPGESGPVLVHVGNVTYVVTEDGKSKKAA